MSAPDWELCYCCAASLGRPAGERGGLGEILVLCWSYCWVLLCVVVQLVRCSSALASWARHTAARLGGRLGLVERGSPAARHRPGPHLTARPARTTHRGCVGIHSSSHNIPPQTDTTATLYRPQHNITAPSTILFWSVLLSCVRNHFSPFVRDNQTSDVVILKILIFTVRLTRSNHPPPSRGQNVIARSARVRERMSSPPRWALFLSPACSSRSSDKTAFAILKIPRESVRGGALIKYSFPETAELYSGHSSIMCHYITLRPNLSISASHHTSQLMKFCRFTILKYFFLLLSYLSKSFIWILIRFVCTTLFLWRDW